MKLSWARTSSTIKIFCAAAILDHLVMTWPWMRRWSTRANVMFGMGTFLSCPGYLPSSWLMFLTPWAPASWQAAWSSSAEPAESREESASMNMGRFTPDSTR